MASRGLVPAQCDVLGVHTRRVGRPRHVCNSVKARGVDAGLAYASWYLGHESGRRTCDVALETLLGELGGV